MVFGGEGDAQGVYPVEVSCTCSGMGHAMEEDMRPHVTVVARGAYDGVRVGGVGCRVRGGSARAGRIVACRGSEPIRVVSIEAVRGC